MITLTGCFEKDGSDGVVKYDIPYNPSGLDPQTANDRQSFLIISSLYTGLLKINPDGSLSAGVAEDYTVSEDGLTYKFKLCSDYYWTDVNGYEAPCTANDFVYGFQRLFNPETRAPRASEYFCIKNSQAISLGATSRLSLLGVKAVGDYELEITLDYPNPNFLTLLTEAPAMPCNEQYFIASQGRYGLSDETTPSNGAFYLKLWQYDPYSPTDNNYLTLRRHAKNNETHKVYPAGLNFFIEGDEDFTDDFISGVTSCIAVTDKQFSEIKGDYSCTEYDAITVGLLLNTNYSLFKTREFRRALSLLVDREEISQNITGINPAYAIVPGEVSMLDKSYRELAGEKLTEAFSHANAAAELEKIGELDKNLLSGARIIMKEDANSQAALSQLTQQWQSVLNFYCVIETLPEADFNARLASGDFELAVTDISGSVNSPAAYLQCFKAGAENNFSGFADNKFNMLFAGAQRAADLSKSAELYAQAERLVLEQAVFIPLYYRNEYFLMNKDFADIYYNPFNKTVDFSQAKVY